MKKLYDLCVVTSKYTQNGQDKNRYENIGSIWENNDRKFITLKAHFNPAAISRKEGSDSILVSLFAAKENAGSNTNYTQDTAPQGNSYQDDRWDRNAQPAGADNGSGIPF